MKRILHILAATALVVLTTACEGWLSPEKPEKRMVLLYIAATEVSLSPYAEGNITDMLTGYVPERNSKTEELLVFFQNRDTDSETLRSAATLTRYYTNRSGKVVAENVATYDNTFDAGTPEALAKVLAAAEAACSPTSRCLLFSSHGTGWMPTGYFDDGGESSLKMISRKSVKESDYSDLSRLKIRESIGYDAQSKNEIDIRDFASVLGKYHWDGMLLDCCYMGAIEVAYELRNCCDWIIASPTEILITGFPYPTLLENLFRTGDNVGFKNICQQYYEMYQSQSGKLQSATIALVNSKELESLAQLCAKIVTESRTAVANVDRMSVQRYFYNSSKDYFFDLSHYFEQFASTDSFASFSSLLTRAIPCAYTTEKFLGLPMEHFCGVSCYIPSPKYPKLNAYYKQLAWNQAVKIIE